MRGIQFRAALGSRGLQAQFVHARRQHPALDPGALAAAALERFRDLPTISRAELSRDIARLVPDSAPLERLINFRTSGTTGHPLLLASHPVVGASYLAFHKRALRRLGIELRHGRGQTGVVLIGWQRKCFTYVSVTPTMDESGLAKINLHADDWRHPDDRAKYLDALSPEAIAGDPISFAELLELPIRCRAARAALDFLPAVKLPRQRKVRVAAPCCSADATA